MPLCAAEAAARRELLEAARELLQLRCLQLAREAGRADVGADLQVLRDGPVRLLAAAARPRELDQARTMQHPDVEVKVARVDAQPGGELTVRERPVALRQDLEDLQAKGMTERL